MKKVIALLLAFVMVLALCGCGNTQGNAQNTQASPAATVSPREETPTIQENTSQPSSVNIYGFAYQGPGSLGQESVEPSQYEGINFNGLWIDTASGATFEFYDDPNGAAIKHTSADGKSSHTRFNWILDGNLIRFPYQEDVVIAIEENGDILQLKYNNGVYLRDSDYYMATGTLRIGETVETDSAVFTLNRVSFVNRVNPNTLTPSDSGGLGASPDMCYAYLEFSLKNTGKEACDVGEVLDFTIDYDDGYVFEMKGDEYSHLGIAHTTINRKIAHGTSSGSRISLSPLTGDDYVLLIPCADAVAKDTTSPLKIFVSIPTSQGHQIFIYEIR